MRVVDLNADLGEIPGVEGVTVDRELLSVVTSANVACGGHAGDAASMRRVCAEAASSSVSIGAQVSYVDRVGFGRRRVDVDSALLAEQLMQQVTDLATAASAAGTRVSYLKPHGALYHAAALDPEVASIVAAVAHSYDLPVLSFPHGHLRNAAVAMGVPAFAEVFADRAYETSGHLVPRDHPAAVVHDPADVIARVVDWATSGSMRTIDGELIEIDAVSLCLHGDTPGAVDLAQATRAALESANVRLAPFAGVT